MSTIKAENLTFAYPSGYDNIFENASFQIDTDWKLGFIGRNGRGKTTFLNLLMGKYEYKGKITSAVQFDYFPYHVKDKSKTASEIMGEICPEGEEWELIRELSYLETDAQVLYRPFESLSEGEKTKVLLGMLFLKEENFLLIDEPTNHLDLKGRELVAAYLNRKKGFILVSHDRRFLDGCVDHILSINRAGIEVQKGNFSTWWENFMRRQEFEAARSQQLKKDISRLRLASQKNSLWSDKTESSKIGGEAADRGYVGHKAAKMMKRSKTIEQRQQKAILEKSQLLKNLEESESLKLSQLSYYSDTLISFSNVEISYGGKKVCGPVSFEIKCGERVALDGKNGSGKSSILKLITGESIEHSGTVSLGSGIIVSYVPQNTSNIKGKLSDFAKENNIDESLFKTILRKMDFRRVQFEKDISDFSEGQKKKVLIAKSICTPAHLYVWDEPLNFIDIYSRMQIEQLIKEYSPTMIFVEHDKAFREETATMTVNLNKY